MRWLTVMPSLLVVFASAWGPGAQAADAPHRPRIAFVSHAPDSDTWWTPIKNAIAQASEDFGADVDYLNPKDGSIASMVAILAALRPDHYDGVVTTLADFQAERSTLMALVNTQHLPLITVNSGTTEQSQQVGALVHIGQPEHASGLAAGLQAYKAGVRNYVCFNHDSNNAATHERCDGFGEGLGIPKGSHPELPLNGSPEQIRAEIGAWLATHSPAPAILALGPTSADPTVDALRKLKKGTPTPYFVTYDLSPAIVGGIKDRLVAFAIDQQPYAQGYLSVALMAEYLAEGRPESFKVAEYTVFAQQKMHARMSRYGIELKPSSTTSQINSGPGFVTPLNVDLVERYSGRFR